MNTRFKVGFALVAMTTALMMSGCSTASSNVATTADCQDATTQFDAANSALTSARANLTAVLKDDNKVGTRYESDARSALTDAQKQQQAALDVKSTACVDTSTAEPTAEPTTEPSANPTVDTSVLTQVITDALAASGFTEDQYTVGTVDTATDNSTAAAGAFSSDKKLQTPQDVVEFLSSGTPQAEAVIAEAIKQTGATRAELLATANWIPVQFTGVSVQWGGNTYYTDAGVNTESGAGRVDEAGTVAVIFVPPRQVAAGKVTSIFVLRGACGNPQTEVPHPYTPPTTIPPTTIPPTTIPPTTPPSGKHAPDSPTPDAPIVPAPPDGYVDRTGTTHTEPYVPPASTVPPAEVGQGDSGSGATNTVPPPATSSPPAEVPVTTAPTTPPPAMP